ncbi:MbnP family copper-binding protein [Nostoc sp. FACHB-110]|uniref:MbnP family copper-binding protein n=1 Tax=Nostoc sp. FACHB-110 TaxID=2692834 RepID=UPI001F55567D|nr:MbnP family copper-binding protein [Nostoc sp. FACHB-110]
MTTGHLTGTNLLSRIDQHPGKSTGKVMQLSVKLAAIAIVVIPLTTVWENQAVGLPATNQSQVVTIRFNAKVGQQPFECGKTYTLGKPAMKMTFSDLRFYVSDVALIDHQGKVVPLTLTQDGKWQYQNVALLDFENKSGACVNGTVETRNQVIGTVPQGNYQGLQFNLGIPFHLNHADSAIAPSPLNLTSLWWNWLFGYKFARIDLENHNAHAGQKHTEQAKTSVGFPIHLGSTGCQATQGTQQPSTCTNQNLSKIVIANFDSTKNLVIADIAALVANTNLAVNQPDTPPGCMSSPDDRDCVGIMANLGLSFAGQPASSQKFFRVER